MSLREYQRKRDFERTPEPSGRAKKRAKGRSYVIQKHDASRLHYDFRLEDRGVLKSWAVPKGPSLDPREKRLAVEVEDHPLEYGEFEGVIPEGQYGGGTVLLWDRGHWIPDGDPDEGLRRGRLRFELRGDKLGGAWALVRMKGKNGDRRVADRNWLLIKSDDEAARGEGDILLERPESVESGLDLDAIARERSRVWRSDRHGEDAEPSEPRAAKARGGAAAKKTKSKKSKKSSKSSKSRGNLEVPRGARRGALPRSPGMQLATLVAEPPSGDDWLHEIKLDGYRVLCRVEGGRATLRTRGDKDWSDRFPTLVAAAAELPVKTALLDGEVVALGADGRSSFQELQRAMQREPDALRLFAFDLLHLDGFDLQPLPLEVRKQALAELLRRASKERASEDLRYSDHVVGGGDDFFRAACGMSVEGIVSKRRDAPYRAGRTRSWLKVKCLGAQEVVIGGFTDPSGSRSGFGALLVGVHEDGKLRYAGKVGTGFDQHTLDDLERRLRKLERKTSPFVDPPRGAAARRAHWVRPELVAQVTFTEWTSDRRLRHPSFQGLREDKPATDVVREVPAKAPSGGAAGKAKRGSASRAPVEAKRGAAAGRAEKGAEKSTGKSTGKSSKSAATVAGVALSNPDKVLYPEQGLTKLDLARYYERVAEWILPHVSGRPLTLVRCPEGHAKACFYQKHIDESPPPALHPVPVTESDGERATYRMVDDIAGIVSLVQLGVLEIHVWGSRADHLEQPDWLVFDVDPSPELPWRRVAGAARALRDRLEQVGLQSWLKTTGGKGLHVVVPLVPDTDWEVAKPFSRALVQSLMQEHPDLYLIKASKSARRGKVFLDYLRNSRGATAVVAFSSRARSGAPVSMPLRWDELHDASPPVHTVESAPKRLARLRSDPWEGFWKSRQSLARLAQRG